jgi:CMP-N-acetylneuraminic acid synthetase
MNKPAITALITVQQTNNSYVADAHFKTFGGVPLFQLMIDKLLGISSINRVVITTDSDIVKTKYGINPKVSIIDFPSLDSYSDEVPVRILQDMLTSDKLTANSLDKSDGEHFLQTQCINPLLSVQTIEDAIERYYTYVLNDEYQQFDSVMSLYRLEKRLYDSSNYPQITLRDNPHYVIFEDTVFNLFNRTAFNRNQRQKFGKNPMFYEVSELESMTVETPTGLILARLAYDNQALFL